MGLHENLKILDNSKHWENTGWKGNAQNGRKYLHVVDLIREQDPENPKNSWNSTIMTKQTQRKSGQRTREDVSLKATRVVSTHMERRSASRIIGELQINTTVRHPLTVETSNSKNSGGCRETETRVHCGCSHCGDSVVAPQKIKNGTTTCPAIPKESKAGFEGTFVFVFNLLWEL